MIVVIFELQPAEGAVQQYLDTAAALRETLQNVDGFISVERFQSLTESGRYLSLSYWRDEQAVKSWRQQPEHKLAQELGRKELFADYQLTVASVVRHYGPEPSVERPA